MKKLIFTLLITLVIFINRAGVVFGEAYVAQESAKLAQETGEDDFDYRVVTLRKYLQGHNSPLSDSAEHFVAYADAYGLDWRMVPAISGVESTFGKRIPKNSYNAYGWANGNYSFESWEDSIEKVSRTLREKYYDKGATTINQIARKYAPPSTSWAWKVNFFMDNIDPVPVVFDL